MSGLEVLAGILDMLSWVLFVIVGVTLTWKGIEESHAGEAVFGFSVLAVVVFRICIAIMTSGGEQ